MASEGTGTITLGLWWRRRRLGYKACGVPTCPGKRSERGLGGSAWCEDHTDAIFAKATHTRNDDYAISCREAAERVGVRRWALKAEIDAEIERRHVPVLESILEQDDFTRTANRFCWDHSHMQVKRGIDLGPRVDELLVVAGPKPCPKCGHTEEAAA